MQRENGTMDATEPSQINAGIPEADEEPVPEGTTGQDDPVGESLGPQDFVTHSHPPEAGTALLTPWNDPESTFAQRPIPPSSLEHDATEVSLFLSYRPLQTDVVVRPTIPEPSDRTTAGRRGDVDRRLPRQPQRACEEQRGELEESVLLWPITALS